MTIDAVVFDLGGVFTDSPFEAIRAMADDHGTDVDALLGVFFGPYDRDTDHPWHRAERGELDMLTTRREIRDMAREHGLEIDLFDMLKYMASDGGVRHEVVACTRRVRDEGRRTALLTNNLAEFSQFWRPLLPLEDLFDLVVDSSEVGMRKPDPRIYQLVLEQLGGVPPDRAVFLDDFEGNVVAARRLGMTGIVVGVDPAPALAELDELLVTRPRSTS
jgi:epoxide hydrolase-like predicted phosphatase